MEKMKRVVLGLILSLAILSPTRAQVVCDYTIPPGVSVANSRTNYTGVKPGDTVCFEAGQRGSVALRNFSGTISQPITFINTGGQVVFNSTDTHAILIQNSRYFRLTGTGDDRSEYGIKIIASGGHGVRIGYKSSDFLVDHIEVSAATGTGITALSSGVCSDGSTNNYDYDGDGAYAYDVGDVIKRGVFTQTNSIFHDNYIHNVKTEGLYIGSSSYSNGAVVACTAGTEIVLDPVLVGVEVYNNRIEATGWDGIQVGSAVDDCNIYNNDISRDSQANIIYQQSGIMDNPGNVCDIHHNFISNGGGTGIYLQGAGGGNVYNNTIINAGRNGNNRGHGITVNSPKSTNVFSNVIINPLDYAFSVFGTGGGVVQTNTIISDRAIIIATQVFTKVVVSGNSIFANKTLTPTPTNTPTSTPTATSTRTPTATATPTGTPCSCPCACSK